MKSSLSSVEGAVEPSNFIQFEDNDNEGVPLSYSGMTIAPIGHQVVVSDKTQHLGLVTQSQSIAGSLEERESKISHHAHRLLVLKTSGSLHLQLQLRPT